MIGTSLTSTGQRRAFFWENGVLSDLGTLNGQECFSKCSTATSLNDRGQVVGFINLLNVAQLPFVWENGIMSGLPLLDGGSASEAVSINNRSQILGGGNAASGDNQTILWTPECAER